MARKVKTIRLKFARWWKDANGKLIPIAAGSVIKTADPEEAAQMKNGGNEWADDKTPENIIPQGAAPKKRGRPAKKKEEEPAAVSV